MDNVLHKLHAEQRAELIFMQILGPHNTQKTACIQESRKEKRQPTEDRQSYADFEEDPRIILHNHHQIN